MALTKVVYTDDVTVIDAQNMNDIQDAIIGVDSEIFVGDAIPSSADLNNYTTAGQYYSLSSAVSASLSNCPHTTSGFFLSVYWSDPTMIVQNLYVGDTYYGRRKASGGWTAWCKYMPLSYTVVSTF